MLPETPTPETLDTGNDLPQNTKLAFVFYIVYCLLWAFGMLCVKLLYDHNPDMTVA